MSMPNRKRREELRQRANDAPDGHLACVLPNELRALLDALDRRTETLRDLREYFDNYADVEDSSRGVAEMPNEAMEWKQAIDAELEQDNDSE